jgi:hypothetical protein
MQSSPCTYLLRRGSSGDGHGGPRAEEVDGDDLRELLAALGEPVAALAEPVAMLADPVATRSIPR